MIEQYTYPPQSPHKRQYFYKYVTASTALIILTKNSLRWSHPSLFNDSFELQISGSTFCDTSEIRRAMKRQALRKFKHCLHGKRYTDIVDSKYTYRDFLKNCNSQLELIRENFESLSKGYLNELSEIYKSIRIICLAEECDNILMWSHYADSHSGVVLRFEVQRDESADDPFVMAQKVQYSSEPLHFFTAEELLQSIFDEQDYAFNNYFPTHCFVKHDIWSYESEWRLIDIRSDSIDRHDDYNFKISKLSGIYFGCKCRPQSYFDISQVMSSKYPNAELFMAKMDSRSYKLLFSEIKK